MEAITVYSVLQLVGMTGKQLKSMLILEGLYYELGAVAVTLLLILVSVPLLSRVMNVLVLYLPVYNHADHNSGAVFCSAGCPDSMGGLPVSVQAVNSRAAAGSGVTMPYKGMKIASDSSTCEPENIICHPLTLLWKLIMMKIQKRSRFLATARK